MIRIPAQPCPGPLLTLVPLLALAMAPPTSKAQGSAPTPATAWSWPEWAENKSLLLDPGNGNALEALRRLADP